MAKRIHIVEDSTQMLSYLKEMIGAMRGTEVSGSSDTADLAIKMIKREQPAIVLLDLALREGDGIHVLRAVKRFATPPVVIVLTNHATDYYRSRSLQYGADYFFDKSLEFEQAMETIRELTAGGSESTQPRERENA